MAVAMAAASSPAHAESDAPFSSAGVLDDEREGLRLRSTTVRVTGFDQYGHGYQSQAGPLLGPGSERATIFEPQVEVIATQGDRLTHRVWMPADVVTNASPDAIDVLTSASRKVEGGSIDWSTTYKASPTLDVTALSGIHIENPFRSWSGGFALSKSFADDATVLGASALEVFDWFDRFAIDGTRHGRADRTSSTGSVALTQIVTPTTIVNLNYGLTVQDGELGNTWNSVPLAAGFRGPELLPDERTRSALVGRAAQWLPWNGALRGYYRFYADSWGIVAHSIEGQLLQRVTPELYVGGYYRFHTQTGATFFTTLAPVDATLRTADSDLAPLDSQAFGGKIVVDLPTRGQTVRALHFELECERYFRTNDLQVNVVSWETGLRF